MSDRSAIEWTDATWNPLRGTQPGRVHSDVAWMCVRADDDECIHCYASGLNERIGGGQPYLPPGNHTGQDLVRIHERTLMEPYRWKGSRKVFVCSMTDLFGEWVPEEAIARVFAVMTGCPQHTFQVLTKRARRLAELAPRLPWTPNIWAGVSVGVDRYSWRSNHYLRQVPAQVHFVSAEPLLGPLPALQLDHVDWLIAGGESGHVHRLCEADWVRDLRDRAQAARTAFFFKQWGGRTHAAGGRLLDGRTWDEFPGVPAS
jgi:protein gp37